MQKKSDECLANRMKSYQSLERFFATEIKGILQARVIYLS